MPKTSGLAFAFLKVYHLGVFLGGEIFFEKKSETDVVLTDSYRKPMSSGMNIQAL